MDDNPFRVGIEMLVLLCITAFYIPLNKRKPVAYVQHRWDRKIPLVSLWVFPYALYFPFVWFSTIRLLTSPLHQQFFWSFAIGSVAALGTWFLFPTGVKRPDIPLTRSYTHRLLQYFYTHDGDTNAIPSGHVLHTVICTYFLFLLYPQYIWVITGLGVCICLSTVLTKQHYIVDVLAGLGVAFISMHLGALFIF